MKFLKTVSSITNVQCTKTVYGKLAHMNTIWILSLLDFQLSLCEQYRKEYFDAQQKYAKFADANRNVILQAVTSEKDRLQKNLSLAEQIYSQSMGQLQVLRGKVQEAKPVFAVVEPATVPLAPASPKKMLIIIAFAFLAFVLESAWILFGKDIYHDFKNELKKKD